MLSTAVTLRMRSRTPHRSCTKAHHLLITSSKRLLFTTSPLYLPRQPWSSVPRFTPSASSSVSSSRGSEINDKAKTLQSSSSNPPQAPANPSEPPSSPSMPSSPSPSPPHPLPSSSFPDMAVSLLAKFSDFAAPMLPEYRPLLQTLTTSFLPANQSASTSGRSPSDSHQSRAGSLASEKEPVIALVSPFEGGDAYISRAVQAVASHLDAEVLKIDLTLALGLDGTGSPLSEAAPSLPSDSNPLLRSPNGTRAVDHSAIPSMEEDEDVPEEIAGKPGVLQVPVLGLAPGLQMMQGSIAKGSLAVDEKWVAFFQRLINLPSPSDDSSSTLRKRIILLESSSSMAETFEFWWPSLLEAVRQRRSTINTSPKRPLKRGMSINSAPLAPTTVILSCSPSLLLPHTGEVASGPSENSAGVSSDIRSTIESALTEKFGNVGISVIGAEKVGSNEEKIWWSSEESDNQGRKFREERRLKSILNDGPGALLPSFTCGSNRRKSHLTGSPLLDSLLQRSQSTANNSNESRTVWRTLAILPPSRDTSLERKERIFRRRIASVALLQKALSEVGGHLEDPLAILKHSEGFEHRGRRSPASRRRADAVSALLQEWDECVISWFDAQDLASATIGHVTTGQAEHPNEPITVQWQDIFAANLAEIDSAHQTEDIIKQYLSSQANQQTLSKDANSQTNNSSDALVDGLKKGKNITAHEKRLLPCIVDTAKLASTSFQDVHLPNKTIDGIRTLVSLPLLYPNAFHGGILRHHATSGALLFGPPGTGKTLLVRAVAKEGGARMLAIQPSDVNDMYVGEGEKMVKAVFSLARKLSPCVIFLDEVDSLFGARASRDTSGGAKAHNQVITEFMQEMDGLSSAISNRDKRVVVIGATNRPFDLDDAILRRLPRRLLIDLPGTEDRFAILKILLRDEVIADDVDLDRLARETEGYSGSDLKHLCISAALASLKEVVHLPWVGDAGSPPPPAPSPHNGNDTAREDSIFREADNETTTPSVVSSMKTSKETVSADQDPILSPQVVHAPSKETRLEDVGQLQKSENPSPTNDQTAQQPSGDGLDKQQPLSRIIHRRHFTIALAEIRPSSTEEGTLPELRRWAEQYGEGGNRRGTKTGFGIGFGFGTELRNSRNSGYGRVSQE